uniref:Anaphylatoxin-like domain-containing protein n=1 Tax=Periophthalmus magnuspinnatus TaxID=409849 RepID=A0A3B4BHG8_9GOBI
MSRTVLWLLASLGLACFTAVTDVMSAPNLLRVGTVENIFVECQDCAGKPAMNVEITAWNYPTKNLKLNGTSVTLDAANKYQALGEFVIPPGSFEKNPKVKQYVYLKAAFPGFTLEKVVLVSFQSGYMFIQTDKTLYTPESMVRLVILTHSFHTITMATNLIVFVLCCMSMDSIGQWKIRSKFQSNPQESYSAEFEVKKYVLPSYEVKLTPEIAFFYFDSDSFQVSIKANYLFGKAVNGMAYVVFGVMEGEIRKVFPSSLQRIPINDGAGEAFLRKQHIIQTFPNKETLVGKSLFVTAMVHTESGSEMVEGEIRNIQIVKSPYVLNFDKTPKYFKPGMSFDVTVTVTNPDGSPAEGVPVVLSSGPNIHGTTRANGRTTLTVNTRSSDKTLTVTVRSHWKHIRIIKDFAFTIVFFMLCNFRQRPMMNILSRGQLVGFGRQLSDGQVTVVMIIPVTKKMLPSFRIIVYYHPTPSEVVSDSIWVDVDDSCMGTLKLEPKFPVVSYEPRRTFNLKVTGDPGATVGLVAVDKGVYVLNKKHLLTQKKIVEKADTGCTPGGGRNSMGVFFDAGLLFQTDTAEGTAYRQGNAPFTLHNSLKKRASTLFDVRTTLVSTYSNSLQRECCLDGMKNTPLSYDCATRKRYITDGKECEDAFLYCCEELAKQRSELKEDNLILARSEEDNSYMDSSEIISRTNFPESWQWVTFKIPQCGKRDCQTEMGIPLKDSITTWVFTGISLSQNTGICVGKPLDVVVYKEFFLDLKLPYSAVVGEQIELRAIIHNYIQDEVRIELIETPNVCSAASKRGKFTQEVSLGPSSTRAVMFVIIPMEKGSLRIEVKAAVKNSWHSDGVIKQLLVVVRTCQQYSPYPVTGISKIEMVPGTPSSTKIFVTDQVSPLLETVIGGSAMGKLIVLPTGCGEQNMYHMTKPVIATTYLDNTNQWESVGLGKRSDALSHIKTGFQNEMKYAKPDGSFAVWPNAKSSTWLTAYVVKVFAMASNLVAIPNSAICNAVQWLILNTQKPDGMFTEVKMVYHREYTGDVHGRDSDASLTAFCLIAMQESKRICEPIVNSLPNAVDKSVTYLEKRLPSLTNPYAVTITSYALANENRLNKETLYRFASSERDHWTSPLGHVFSLEATAYALLALVKGRVKEARPVVRWLTNQQKVGGGYGSTQATIMVYQAVSEYWTVAQEPDYNLDVKLKIPGRANLESFRFTRDNRHTTRTSSVSAHSSSGSLLTQYYAPPKDTLRIHYNKHFLLFCFYSFKNPKEAAKMSILDIALPTGFIPINDDLNALSEGRARVLSGWEFNKDLTDKGSLILYKDELLKNLLIN